MIWLVEDGVHQVCLFRAPIWYPSGGGGTQESGGTIEEGLVNRVSTQQIGRGRKPAQSSTSQVSAEPLSAKIKGANRDVFEGKAHLWPRSVFPLRRPTRSGERARSVGHVIGMHRAWTTGCWLARQLQQFKASNTMNLGISIFLICV